MEKKKTGRPKSITTDKLVEIMLDVASRFPGKITYSLLQRETGISRRVWQYDKECVKTLEKINAEHLNLSIVSEVDLVQRNLGRALKEAGSDEAKVNVIVNQFTETMNSILKVALEGQKHQKKVFELENEINDLKEQLEISRENEEYYKKLLAKMAADGKYTDTRKMVGLKKDYLLIEENLHLAGSIGAELDEVINSLLEE